MKVVDSIRKRYKEELRYLLDAEFISDRRLKGKFKVNNSVHLKGKKLKHLAITECQMCLNQLFQVYVAKLIEEGYVEEWGPMHWNDYWGNLSSEHLFVVESYLVFNEKILPEKEFCGTITLQEEYKTKKGNYHLIFNFNLDDGSHTGKFRIAFVP
jgi:hypothetical protein